MAASEDVLGRLHTKVAEVLSDALDGQIIDGYTDPETGEETEPTKIPPSAAIIAAATKFLKDNNITCAPSQDNALGELEAKMKERQERRRVSKADFDAATEHTSFLTGLH